MRAFCERELLKLRASLKEAEECRATLKARVSSLEERLAESDSLYDCTVQNIRVHRTQQLVLCKQIAKCCTVQYSMADGLNATTD